MEPLHRLNTSFFLVSSVLSPKTEIKNNKSSVASNTLFTIPTYFYVRIEGKKKRVWKIFNQNQYLKVLEFEIEINILEK